MLKSNLQQSGKGLVVILSFFFLYLLTVMDATAQNEQDSLKRVAMLKAENYYKSLEIENHIILSEKWFHPRRYLNSNPDNYIENFTHEAYVQNETAGDFSRPDDNTISINGASFKWNRYYWNGFAIHSLVNPGAGLHKIDLNKGIMKLDPSDLSLNFHDDIYTDSAFVRVRGQFSPFFDLIPNASEIAAGITGHKSSFQRKVNDFDYRRRTDHQYSIYTYLPTNRGYNQFYFNKGKRFHTSFDKTGLVGDFPENYTHFNASNRTDINTKYFNSWYTMFSARTRDAYQAEWNYEAQETGTEDQFSLSSFLKGGKNDFNYSLGLNMGYRSIDKQEDNFYRNVYDLDGEGFEPLYPFAKYIEMNPVISINKSFDSSEDEWKRAFKLNGQFENGLIHFSPNKEEQQAFYYFDPSEEVGDYTALYNYKLSSESFNTFLANDRVAIDWEKIEGRSKFSAGLAGQYSGVWSPDVAISDFSLDMNLGWEVKLRSNLSFGLLLAKRSMPLNYSLVQYLESSYLDGVQNKWQDSNNDQQFDESEINGLFRNYGGGNRGYADNLKMNKIYSLEIPIKWQITNVSRLELIGRFNSFRDLWWVSYDKAATEYGHFEEVVLEEDYPDSDNVFFLDNPDVGYVLKPFDTDLMTDNTETDNILFDNPFYAGATLSYYFDGKDVFIKTSFTAYEVVGPGMLGNGPQANSLGLMSDNMANPNANIHVLGRLNPDRSYLFSFMIGHNVSEKFNYSVIVNYKDGQSFNGYNTSIRNDQIAVWNHGIPGDNPFTGEFNKREDGFWNVELRAEYASKWRNKNITFHAEIYNFFDIGWEINEYTFRPFIQRQRPALDIQIPRGLIFGMDVSL